MNLTAKEIILIIASFVAVAGWITTEVTYSHEKQALEYELKANDLLIKQLHKAYLSKDSAYRRHILNYDSIQTLRYENDTLTYSFSADSIQQLWADRFSD